MTQTREPRGPEGGAQGSAGGTPQDNGTSTISPPRRKAERTDIAPAAALPLPKARRSTSLLDALGADVRRLLKERGLTLAWLSDVTGLNDGHPAHLLSNNGKNGRGGRLESWQLIFDAMHPNGFNLHTESFQPGAREAAIEMPKGPAGRLHWRTTRYFQAIGARGGQRSGVVRREKAAVRRRLREQGRHGAAIRWSKSEKSEAACDSERSGKFFEPRFAPDISEPSK